MNENKSDLSGCKMIENLVDKIWNNRKELYESTKKTQDKVLMHEVKTFNDGVEFLRMKIKDKLKIKD